jgi:NADH dehydrogenase FAD-containing subunit/CRP-like cAMP-binding protein
MTHSRVVIVGGGFAGLQCAKTLRTHFSSDACEVVLFNRENHMVFHPLLAEVAGGSINPDAVAAPLRQFLRAVHCRTENVTRIDLRNHHVAFEAHDGQTKHLDYDHVVVACGRVVSLGAVPGMSDHAFALKTVGDAVALRAQVIQMLEHAEVCDNPEQRRWLLSFIVVGGGFSGVEVAGEINDLVRSSLRFYPHIDRDEIAVTLVAHMDAPKENGALRTEPDMRLSGHDRAWAIGDCARITNALDMRACPPTAQFAERQGRQVAENIVRLMRGEPTRPFAFKPLGQLCAIGRRSAVAELFGWRVSGFPAWLLWRTVYLLKLPSWSRRVKVAADWAWDLLFARDLVTLRIDPTERVSHAYFRRGDYVFRQGDPALNFYAVEKGEVEVIRTDRDGIGEALIAVLGPGDYFGEMALIEHRPRSASVRARTDIEVTTLGANVFSQLSKSLAPLQQRLVESLRRRSTNVAARLPEVHAALQQEVLSSFVEAAPRTLNASCPFHEALAIFARDRIDILYLVDGDQHLVGVLTRSDLLRAVDAAIASPVEQRKLFAVRDFMSPDPISVTTRDAATTAAALMWGRGLKTLPVLVSAECRRVAGCVRAEALMHAVTRRLRAQRALDLYA